MKTTILLALVMLTGCESDNRVYLCKGGLSGVIATFDSDYKSLNWMNCRTLRDSNNKEYPTSKLECYNKN